MSVLFPSSQASPESTWPLPHTSLEQQSALQPSPSMVLPSSHASVSCPAGQLVSARISVSTRWLPQVSSERQSDAQPSPLSVLPSSQTSPTAVSSMPLPQTSSRQSAEQPSPETMLPSSHCSPAALTKPSPQSSKIQVSCTSAQRAPTGQTSPDGQVVLPGSTQERTVKAAMDAASEANRSRCFFMII